MDIPLELIFGFAGLVLCVVIFLLIKKMRAKKGASLNISYVKKGAEGAQTEYDNKFKDPNPLTKDEKIELSWQFLYGITDIVLEKFSKEDREQVAKIGHQMLEAGTGYEHVIEYGLKPVKKRSHLIEEEEKSQDQEIKR